MTDRIVMDFCAVNGNKIGDKDRLKKSGYKFVRTDSPQ